MIYEDKDNENMVIHLQETDFQGQVASIRITDIIPINGQSCDVQEVTIEYADKVIQIKHTHKGELGAMQISKLDKWNDDLWGRKVFIATTDVIAYDHSTYKDGELDSLTFRWNDTWLHIFRLEYDIAFTRSSCDLTDGKSWPSPNGEPKILLE